MANKIDRKLVEVYAGNSPIKDVQTKDGFPTKDVSLLQDTNYIQGLRTFLTSDGIMSSFESSWNAALYVLSNQIKYATDRGISEYDPDTEYFIGDVVRIVAGGSIYTSKTDNNIGNPLSDINHWQPDLNGSVPIGSEVGIYLPDADIATYYPNWLLARGQEVSRTTYPLLFQYFGTTFGAGDGSDTFNLPDTKDRLSVGAGSTYSIGAKGGSDSVNISTSNMPAHTHSKGTLSTGSAGSHSHSISSTTLSGGFAFTDDNSTDMAVRVRETSGVFSTQNASRSFVSSSGIPGTQTKGYRVNISKTIAPSATSAGSHTHTISGSTGSVGSGSALDVRNKYLAKSFIIRAY